MKKNTVQSKQKNREDFSTAKRRHFHGPQGDYMQKFRRIDEKLNKVKKKQIYVKKRGSNMKKGYSISWYKVHKIEIATNPEI